MDSRFAVQLDDLPEYGLRARSRYAQVVHRFAADRAIPACAGDGGISDNPGDYKRERLAIVASSRKYSLCSRGECFGRIHLAESVDSDAGTIAESHSKRRV